MLRNSFMMEPIPKDCFGAYLERAIIECEHPLDSYRAIAAFLKENGVTDIDERRVAEYCKATFTPPYEKAKHMLDALGLSVEDEELITALERNRAYAKAQRQGYRRKSDQELRISVRLKLSQLQPDWEPDRTALLLGQRIEQLYGSKSNYREYLQALIRKDLSEAILIEELAEKETAK